MSLDVYLTMPEVVIKDCEVYEANITHNLGRMAAVAGLYDCMWRPEEHGYKTAGQIIEPLRAGLEKLKQDPDKFKALNPANGWGDYDGFVAFVENYLAACVKYPDAVIYASR